MLLHHLHLSVRSAVAVPCWAFRFYIRHFLWIGGLSIIPSIHRFTLLFFTPDWSHTTGMILEIGVESIRLLLVWLIIRFSITRDARLMDIGKKERGRRIRSFIRHRWLSLLFQLILMGVATLIFDVFLEGVVGSWIPEDFKMKYMGILLAVKNPTIIAWVFVWLVGIPRQMMLYSPEESKGNRYVTI